mgnify:CR=1 FL=1
MAVHRQLSEDDDMIWPPDDFTGEWVVEWPNGQIKFRSLYLKGKEEGDYLCYWSNGNLAQKGYNEDGICKGIWSDFMEDGTKLKETHYKDSKNFEVHWLDLDGHVEEIQFFEDGVEVRKVCPNKNL